jgi:hypothetical protein
LPWLLARRKKTLLRPLRLRSLRPRLLLRLLRLLTLLLRPLLLLRLLRLPLTLLRLLLLLRLLRSNQLFLKKPACGPVFFRLYFGPVLAAI